ncbi:DUF4294 domain-containing protein [Saprospira grandis]|uniref:DUF4294 domain-containing protein n=1 Tax=Saprospira grandis (strain Lewin) TaxID=984262 RepID=H6L519_SAPGL|nr:DUF4294 domain-containing protein [Saprospira grandis]AFC22891.1 hypothetical protein SGRA_0147 [Saprospira grandis str. Lewin]
MRKLLYILPFLGLSLGAQGQQDSLIREGEYFGTTTFNGEIIPILIIDGDTLPTISGIDVQVSRKRNFENREERRRYHQWRHYAAKVFPLALEAVRLHRQMEEETRGMSRRKKKKYIKQYQKELTPEYEAQLKKLTKSQGYILIKMVERELEQPFYQVIRNFRGRWTAVKWQSMASWYGYNLKTGYDPKDDELLEMILSDLDLSYEYDMYNTDWEKDK